jgi:tRNA G18 (ribose-2'-O)-methylase SpoU
MKAQTVKIFTENNDYQAIDTLRCNRNKRNKDGTFFVEGVRAIEQAVANRWEIRALIYSRETRLSNWAERIIARSDASTHYEMPRHLLEKLSQKEVSSEIIALVAMPEDNLARIPIRDAFLGVVLDRPASPGNMGTILRSCDALRVDGVIITGHSADLYDPETIRATTGSFFCVPSVRLPSHHEMIPWLEGLKNRLSGLQIVGTSAKALIPIDAINFNLPTLLLVGNETHGLSENYKSIADKMANIPMFGYASSINIACATSIILYEISRQRGKQ